MAINPYLYAIITDGTETFTLEDGTANHTASEGVITSWSPAVSTLRSNALGGRGEYEDVVEEIEISVRGTTKQVLYDALAKLKRLLDKADAWRRSNGQQGSAVLFKWCPSGAETSSIASPLQAAILARAEGDTTSFVQMPSDIPRLGIKYELSGVTLRFLRTGLWLHTTQAATHNSVTNGDIATLTFASGQNVSSPTKVDISSFIPSSESLASRGGFVVTSEVANGINIINAEGMTTTNYTSVVDSANAARNTNVLRYTPVATTEAKSGAVAVTVPAGSRLYSVYINAKTSNSAASFLVRGQLSNTYFTNYTNRITITDSSRDWYCLGQVGMNSTETSVSVALRITAASTSYTLDIDTVVLVCLDVGNSRAIRLANDYGLVTTTGTLSFDHRALTKPSPLTNFNSTYDYVYSYSDDPYISTSATTIYATLLSGGTAYWRSGSAATNNWTATRTIGYLTPT